MKLLEGTVDIVINNPGGIKTNIAQNLKASTKAGSARDEFVGADAKIFDLVARAMPTSYERVVDLVSDL